MRKLTESLLIVCMAVCAVVVPSPGASSAADAEASAPLRIGVFDSRAVAIAYAHTPAFRERISAMKAEYRRAKEAGDADLVAELEQRGESRQHLLHKQGFGTWPVDDILATIRDELADVARAAGVDVIVSKWQVVYQRPDAELVDITEFMVQPFDPGEDVMATVAEMKTVDPVPLDELEKHHH